MFDQLGLNYLLIVLYFATVSEQAGWTVQSSQSPTSFEDIDLSQGVCIFI